MTHTDGLEEIKAVINRGFAGDDRFVNMATGNKI